MWLVPLVVLAAVTLPHMDQGDWMRTDGAWYGAIGVQAWRTGDLWTLNAESGVAYFNKPPLGFWIHGLVLHVFGLGPLQARLPSVFAAALCVVATVGMCRVKTGWGLSRHGAATVGVVLAFTLEFFRRTREISLDMWQAAFMLMAAWAVMHGVVNNKNRWILLSGVPIGLALLTKPFIGFLALVLMAIWMLWIGRGRATRWLLGAVAIAMVVAGPWHIGMWMEHQDVYASQYIKAEVADRAMGKLTASPDLSKPWWFYLEAIPFEYWPWVVFMILACVSWIRGERLTRGGGIERWAVVWVVGWLIVLSLFPDRRDRYAIPVWPGLAVLAGVWLARWPWEWLRPVQRWFLSWGWLTVAVGSVIFAMLPIQVQKPIDPQWPPVLAWLEENQPESLWVAGRQTERMARLYLETGQWPLATHNRWGEQIAWPEPGAVILYHTPEGVVPGTSERVLMLSGNLQLTELLEGEWDPSWP